MHMERGSSTGFHQPDSHERGSSTGFHQPDSHGRGVLHWISSTWFTWEGVLHWISSTCQYRGSSTGLHQIDSKRGSSTGFHQLPCIHSFRLWPGKQLLIQAVFWAIPVNYTMNWEIRQAFLDEKDKSGLMRLMFTELMNKILHPMNKDRFQSHFI